MSDPMSAADASPRRAAYEELLDVLGDAWCDGMAFDEALDALLAHPSTLIAALGGEEWGRPTAEAAWYRFPSLEDK